MPVKQSGGSSHPDRISIMLRLLHDAYTAAVDSELDELGFADLAGGRAKVLPFVPDDGIPVGRLAELVAVRKQSMAEMVGQLQRDGFLRSEPNPQDARSRLVFLTARGRDAKPAAVRAGDRVEAQWATITSPTLVERLRKDLGTLLTAAQSSRS